MSSYGIMRTEKRTRKAVTGIELENTRKPDDEEKRSFSRSDIDWEKTQKNVFLIQHKDWNKEITRQVEKVGAKERKDSIVMIDSLYTASPDFFKNHSEQDIQQYFADCLKYHVDTYCQKNDKLILSAVIHYDEATPHLHVTSVPLLQDEKGWHLSAKKILGYKKNYSRRQDEFYEQVSSKYGLERGEQRNPENRKKHLSVQEYKKQQNEKQLAAQELQIQARKEELRTISSQEPKKRFLRGYDAAAIKLLEDQAAYGREAITRDHTLTATEEQQRQQAEELQRRQAAIKESENSLAANQKKYDADKAAMSKNAELLSQREKELNELEKKIHDKDWQLRLQNYKQKDKEQELTKKEQDLNERESFIKRYEDDKKINKTWKDYITDAEKRESAAKAAEAAAKKAQEEAQKAIAEAKAEKAKYEELSRRKYLEIKHKQSRSR